MTATDELHRLLDERGVEWRSGLPNETIVREPINALYVERSDGMMHVYFHSYLTPEQAIAATLGAGTCENDAPEPYYFVCSKCGIGLNFNVRFCPFCGKRVKGVDE